MSYYSELHYTLSLEQEQLEEDPTYINWLNQYNEQFTLDTQTLYNTSGETTWL